MIICSSRKTLFNVWYTDCYGYIDNYDIYDSIYLCYRSEDEETIDDTL